jgi:hypothetical protein
MHAGDGAAPACARHQPRISTRVEPSLALRISPKLLDGGGPGCLNDDLAVINLIEDAPSTARIYKLANTPFARQPIVLAGYGLSGNGGDGFTVFADFGVKRIGFNYMDLYGFDDELGPAGGNEIWMADFDGDGKDTLCLLTGVCTPVLDNGLEATTGPGDSGGPVFISLYGELMIAANSTFGVDVFGFGNGKYGTLFGGTLVSAYSDYLRGASSSALTMVPEPGQGMLFALGAGMLAASRRRRRGA